MRKILFSLMMLAGFAVQAQHNHDHSDPNHKHDDKNLEFKQTEYDFGKIPQGKPVYYSFEILNKGTDPVKLENVTATCGCTTPEWNRESIAPGATDKIKVGYNAAAEGYFEKYITVTYNQNQTKQIKIKGTVWKAPAGSAPANSSVQFLKQQIQ